MTETARVSSRVLRMASRGIDEPITPDNWQDPPFNHWGFAHLSEVVTTAPVSRHQAEPIGAGGQSRGAAVFDGGPLDRFLLDSHTQAILVMRGHEIVDERYFDGFGPSDRHLLMSVSKSLCGLVTGRLVGEGLISLAAPVAAYVPELRDGAFGAATIQQLLDMTASVEYDEDYHNPAAHVHQQDRVAGWRPRQPDDPADTYEFLSSLRAGGQHGKVFQYCSASTDVLAWVIESATGRRYADVLSSALWSRLGCADDAWISVDSGGFAFANGGIACTARDLAKVGRLVLDRGVARGEQVVPAKWIADTLEGGEVEAAAGTIFQSIHPRGSYHNQWWITGDAHSSAYAIGIHGQYLWLDPVANIVIVKFSSLPSAVSEAASRAHVAAFREIVARLS